MAELMEKASFIKNKQTSRYLAEKLKFEEKVAKSKAKVKVFEKLEQPTTVLKIPFAPRKNASYGETKQADSYWNVPPLETPHERCTDRREKGGYLTRNFKMRDPDFTSIDNPSMDLNNAIKDNWQEANDAQSYNLAYVSGGYSEENDYNTEMIYKILQQPAPHVDTEKFDGNPINYQYFMRIFKEVVKERIEDARGRLIRLIKYTDS